ncbi:MAG TPA: tripartite tricarboxylate transporter substrate-binding protein [Bosea sp. (in: a-proteobacteria)]|nr:tripartite tricarboxylate transporter substrate-binding protein [Bosea sp. (in: a-proteobacteria)]
MTIHRRALLAAAFAVGLAGPAMAQSLDITVPSNPGGGFDQTARALQGVFEKDKLANRIQIINTPGGGGTIGLAQFATTKAKRAGSIMVGGLAIVSAVPINKAPVTLDQVKPLARLTGEYLVLAVPKNSPLKNVEELIAKFKADPRSVSWGAGSAGSADHLLIGLLAQAAGVEPKGINYIAHSGGGEALSAVIGGHVTVGVSGYGEFEPQVAAGNLRVLAISSEQRIAGIDAPTFKEKGLDVTLVNWRGVFAPPGLKDDEFKALAEMVDKAVKSPSWKEALQKHSWQDLYLPAAPFETYLARNRSSVTAVLKDIGLAQ